MSFSIWTKFSNVVATIMFYLMNYTGMRIEDVLAADIVFLSLFFLNMLAVFTYPLSRTFYYQHISCDVQITKSKRRNFIYNDMLQKWMMSCPLIIHAFSSLLTYIVPIFHRYYFPADPVTFHLSLSTFSPFVSCYILIAQNQLHFWNSPLLIPIPM